MHDENLDASPDRFALRLSAFGTAVSIESADPVFQRLIDARYRALSVPASDDRPALLYRYLEDEQGAGCVIAPGGHVFAALDRSEALHRIDSELVVALQQRRPELLFLHAAALERGGRACLLAAPSGTGKSTTAWGLLHHGFSYMSDELSALDVEDRIVFPYPRTLSLKQPPPAPYVAPPAAVPVGATRLLPPAVLPSAIVDSARSVAAIFVLERLEHETDPQLHRIGPAEAAARVYTTALNALAHPDRGFASVLRIAHAVPCYRLVLGALDRSCDVIREAFDALPATASSAPANQAATPR